MSFPYSHDHLDDAVRQLKHGTHQTAHEWARRVESRMRADAPWTDRNGPSLDGKNARESLEAEAGVLANGDVVIVARGNRMTMKPWRNFAGAPVNVFLELGTRKMRKREIIKPTVHTLGPELKRMLVTMLAKDL